MEAAGSIGVLRGRCRRGTSGLERFQPVSVSIAQRFAGSNYFPALTAHPADTKPKQSLRLYQVLTLIRQTERPTPGRSRATFDVEARLGARSRTQIPWHTSQGRATRSSLGPRMDRKRQRLALEQKRSDQGPCRDNRRLPQRPPTVPRVLPDFPNSACASSLRLPLADTRCSDLSDSTHLSETPALALVARGCLFPSLMEKSGSRNPIHLDHNEHGTPQRLDVLRLTFSDPSRKASEV